MSALLVSVPRPRYQQLAFSNHLQRIIEPIRGRTDLDLIRKSGRFNRFQYTEVHKLIVSNHQVKVLTVGRQHRFCRSQSAFLAPSALTHRQDRHVQPFIRGRTALLCFFPQIITNQDRIFLADELAQGFLSGGNDAPYHAACPAFGGGVAQFAGNGPNVNRLIFGKRAAGVFARAIPNLIGIITDRGQNRSLSRRSSAYGYHRDPRIHSPLDVQDNGGGIHRVYHNHVNTLRN